MFDSESSRMCVLIPLTSDNLLERPVEMLEAVLTSDDPDVTLAPKLANISILDTNGMLTNLLRDVCFIKSSYIYFCCSFLQW